MVLHDLDNFLQVEYEDWQQPEQHEDQQPKKTATETIGMIFSMSHYDIYGLIFTTTEPNDHYFSGIRVHNREAIVLEVIQICVK